MSVRVGANPRRCNLGGHSYCLTGYTQKELEESFDSFIDTAVAQHIMPTRASFLEKIKNYYDGFSFDGQTKVYNPFSILNFFRKYRFSNYWYESGSVTFIESYFKNHKIESPETYHLIKMQAAKLAAREIEEVCPESFLLQAGYLTIVEYADDYLILDYPNQEVLSSLSEMYLTAIYPIPHYNDVGTRLWACVRAGHIPGIIAEYNAALASLPYQDFAQSSSTGQAGESFYRSLFLMLLRACGLQAHGEMPTCRGRSDVLIVCSERIVVIEFKLARTTGEIAGKWREGEKQIQASGYLEPYATQRLPISSAVFVIDAQKRQIVADRPRLEQTPNSSAQQADTLKEPWQS
ncbi:MAG: AAA family ATPase [Desulfovibrio sp.]|nr:AAA family ATPase [Desulfovibrio sp.]